LTAASAAAARGDARAVSTFFATLFLGVGVHLPFFPVFLAGRGLGADEIGIVLAAPMAARALLLPLLGHAADRIGSLTRAIAAYAAAAFLAFWLIGPAEGFLPLLAASMLLAVFWNAQVPLADAVAMRLARTAGANYGRMRAWGSTAFIAGSFLGGAVIERAGSEAVFWLLAATFTLTLGAAFALARRPVAAPPPTRPPQLRGTFSALRPALPIVVACALVQGSHTMLYGFGSLAWERAGFSGTEIGVLWSVSVGAEIALFALSGRHAGRLPAAGLAAVGATAALVRWAALALAPGYAVTVGLQLLHGLSFGATHLAMVRHVAESAEPGRQGGTQALGATIVALFMASSAAASGPLYGAYGTAAFAAMAVPSLVALVVAAVVAARR
jgi:PPP family 3-phenylpropionic acid transporter